MIILVNYVLSECGKSSWNQLLSNVKSDIRFYPDKKDEITKHYIVVNIFLVILITTLLNY